MIDLSFQPEQFPSHDALVDALLQHIATQTEAQRLAAAEELAQPIAEDGDTLVETIRPRVEEGGAYAALQLHVAELVRTMTEASIRIAIEDPLFALVGKELAEASQPVRLQPLRAWFGSRISTAAAGLPIGEVQGDDGVSRVAAIGELDFSKPTSSSRTYLLHSLRILLSASDRDTIGAYIRRMQSHGPADPGGPWLVPSWFPQPFNGESLSNDAYLETLWQVCVDRAAHLGAAAGAAGPDARKAQIQALEEFVAHAVHALGSPSEALKDMCAPGGAVHEIWPDIHYPAKEANISDVFTRELVIQRVLHLARSRDQQGDSEDGDAVSTLQHFLRVFIHGEKHWYPTRFLNRLNGVFD